MSSPSSSVQEAKRALGGRLREIRHDARLTQAVLAYQCGWERTKVTKIESGVQTPSVHDLRSWCSRCGADEQAEDLIATLRAVETAYVEWRRLERVGMKRFQESALPLYEGTQHLRVYHSHVIPGLLQTPGYLRALLGMISRFRGIPDDDVDGAVEARLDRQRILHGNLRYAAVIEEAVLRYNLGDAEVMAGQLGHLLSAMSLAAVSLAIIPSSVMARPMWVVEGFTLFDSRRVHVELMSAKVTVTRPVEVADYAKAFEELASIAVTGAAARELVRAALTDLDAH